ncbi:MAG: YceI family protein [Panacagrimonas sp.]
MTLITHALAATALAFATAVLAAGSAPIDAGRSRITATFTQMNVAVDGQFKTFKGSIAYDAANPAASSAELSIDTASFDLGDEEYNAEVRKKEWFDSQAHPAATFKSSSIQALGPDRFEAQGTLSLKGVAKMVKAQVSVKTDGATRRFEGELPISRTAFAIGDAEWNEVLEDRVIVKFVIVAPAG